MGAPELIGKAAVIDAPVGKGHVVLFGIRPLWRWESQGTFALVVNTMANWNHLTARLAAPRQDVDAVGYEQHDQREIGA